MQIKFYRYNNLDICPNKLKSAGLVDTINIDAPQIMQNLGISFLLDRAIQANIAEYWLKGIQYIAYVDYSTSGNNMYTYKLTIDNLATAWYNKCFDRYNMVARSNLGNFKNDSSLLRDTQPVIKTYECLDNISMPAYLMTVLTPEPNPNQVRQVSGLCTETYLFNSEQIRGFYKTLRAETGESHSNYPDAVKMKEYINTIVNLCVIDGALIQDSDFSTATSLKLYNTANNNQISEWNITTLRWITSGVTTDPGMPKKLKNIGTTSSQWVKNMATVSTSVPINEDTILGNISFDIRHFGKITMPINAIDTEDNTISQLGYATAVDYKTGQVLCCPVINDKIYYSYTITSKTGETLPLLYDDSVMNWTILATQGAQFANNILNATTVGKLGVQQIFRTATIAGSAINALAQIDTMNSTGTAAKFVGGSDPYRTQLIPTYITISYYPTINKSGYQDRFGKADYTSRNITQLTGPVQTINCIASMNNLNINIINIATQLCDNGIWIL